MKKLFENKSHIFPIVFFFLGIVVLVSADLIIKYQVEKHWVREWSPDTVVKPDEILISFPNDPQQSRLLVTETTVIENFWDFTYIRNYNIGFSLLSFIDYYLSPSAQAVFFKTLQLIGLLFVVGYFFLQKMENYYSFLLILSGGLGNVIDRWYRGYVVDYVKWYIEDSPIEIFNPWPIFNLADALITVGIFSLIIKVFFFDKNHQPTDQSPGVIKNNE